MSDLATTDDPRLDGGLVNLFTGQGVPGKDKKLANRISTSTFLSYSELEELYRNGLIRRYVDSIPETVLRHHPTIKLGTEEDTDDTISKFETFLKDTHFYFALREVMQLQRIYGGAVLVLLIDDGREPHEPVDYAHIKAIRGYAPLSRHEAIADDMPGIDYSKPTYYTITTNQKLTDDQTETYLNVKIHHTRVARFDGLYLPWNTRSRNQGWGQSVIETIWEAWQDYAGALGGLGTLIGEGDLLVHQIPGLMQRIAAGGEEAIRKRLELNNLARSVYGTFVLDKEESLTNLSRNLTNISTATEPFIRHLQAVTGWPTSILMGDSPGGLGKEGRFEERVWAALVESWQTSYCQTPVTEIFSLILAAKEGPTRGRPPESWEVSFPSVFTRTDEEIADLRVKTSQSDNTYIQLGVLNPLEVRQARFGTTEFSLDTTLNDEITEQMLLTTQAQFEAQLAGIEAQREAAFANPEQPGGEAPPEDAEAQPTMVEELQDAAPYDHYEAQGLRIRVLAQLPGGARLGHLVGPDGQRLDSSEAAPFMIFGPHRTRSYKLYRAQFTSRTDGTLLAGPYVTGFASLRAARQAVTAAFPKQNVAGLSPTPEAELHSLRAGWDTY